jgi:hypothetical protein
MCNRGRRQRSARSTHQKVTPRGVVILHENHIRFRRLGVSDTVPVLRQ